MKVNKSSNDYKKYHHKLLQGVKKSKNKDVREAILKEYEDCGDIFESCERVKMLHDFIEGIKTDTK
jgi:hypothetical protein